MSSADGERVSTTMRLIEITYNRTVESTADDSTSATSSSTAGVQAVVVGMTLNHGQLASMRLIIMAVAVSMILFGNALTMWAVLTTDRLRVKTYALTTSLAASDFLVGLVYVNYVAHEMLTSTTCGLATYKSAVRPIERLFLYVSLIHIPAIAFDRFVAILHPLHYENRMTPATIGRIIAVLWFIAAAASLPSYVGFATSVVRPQSCIVTLWPMFETVVEFRCTSSACPLSCSCTRKSGRLQCATGRRTTSSSSSTSSSTSTSTRCPPSRGQCDSPQPPHRQTNATPVVSAEAS
jgi:hypothetical protein